MTITVEKAAETYKEVAQDLNLPEELVRKDSRKLLLDTYIIPQEIVLKVFLEC